MSGIVKPTDQNQKQSISLKCIFSVANWHLDLWGPAQDPLPQQVVAARLHLWAASFCHAHGAGHDAVSMEPWLAPLRGPQGERDHFCSHLPGGLCQAEVPWKVHLQVNMQPPWPSQQPEVHRYSKVCRPISMYYIW